MKSPCQHIQTVVKLPQSEPAYNAKNQKSLPAASRQGGAYGALSGQFQICNFESIIFLFFCNSAFHIPQSAF